MTQSAHETYWETQVLTATPQRLRLMLIEGALKFGRQALECWDEPQLRPQRFSALARCNDILAELYGSIRPQESAVSAQVQELYRFLLVHLAKVSSSDDVQPLRELLEVLESERETWRQVCETMPEAPRAPGHHAGSEQDVSATGLGAIPPHHAPVVAHPAFSGERFSLEA